MANNEIIQFKDDIDNYIGYLSNSEGDIIKSDIKNILDILSTNEKNVRALENQGPIKRVWNNITGKNKKLKEINANNLLNVQKLSLGIISELEKQNMMTREVQVMIFNKLNDIAESNLQLKNFIVEVLNKIADRFENIESQTSFNTLIHEIKEGIYDNNSRILSLLKILSSLSLADIKDDRNMNLLCKVLENNNIIDEKEETLKMYLEDISTFKTEDANQILESLKYYEDDSIISSIIESLKYSSIDEKKKKFMKFTKTLNIIEDNIEIEAELSAVELFNFIIEEIREKSNILKIQNESNEELYNDEIEYIALTEETDTVECNEIEENAIINEYISIDDELIIDNLETKEFSNHNIKINSEIKVDGKLIFENCNIELNKAIRILPEHFRLMTSKSSKNYNTAKNLVMKPTVEFYNCAIKIDGKLSSYIEIGEVNEFENNIPQLTFKGCKLEVSNNLDSSTLIYKNIICITGKTDIHFEKTYFDNSYNLILINQNQIVGGYINYNKNPINTVFIDCQFNNTKGYIIHRGYEINLLIKNCSIKNHTPIVDLNKEIRADIDSRNFEFDQYKGKYIINCNPERITLLDSDFSDIRLPILLARTNYLTIDKCNFNNCISNYETINLDSCLGQNSISISNSSFNNCNTLVISSFNFNIDGNKFENMNSIAKTVKREDIKHRGGAMYINGATFSRKIYKCTFLNCNARVGGAIYTPGNKDGIIIENSKFQNCRAKEFGGAIRIFTNYYEHRYGVKVVDCEFVNCNSGKGTDEKYIVDYRCNYNAGFLKEKWEWFDSARLENCSFSE